MKIGRTVSAMLFICCFEETTSLTLYDIMENIHQRVDDVVLIIIKAIAILLSAQMDLQHVRFYLYTSQEGGDVDNIVDPSNPKEIGPSTGRIFILIHGWSRSRSSCPWYKPLTEVLLNNYPDCQVIQVDWGELAGNAYPFSAFITEGIGQLIALLIERVVQTNSIPLHRIVIIGHSLGGQIAGWTGRKYLDHAKTKLSRIIALDPAAPLFTLRPVSRRLNGREAEAVITIHTDTSNYGFSKNCGTIDFYPNGGFNQPGCKRENLTVSEKEDEKWCSHRRSYELFIEALKRPQAFMATKCLNFEHFKKDKCDKNEKISMGDWMTNETGSFYLETTGEPPFM